MKQVLEQRPLLILASGAAAVSLAPILVKAVVLRGLGPTAIGMWRCVLGAMIVFAIAIATRHRLQVPRRRLLLLILAGVVFAIDLFVWHRSVVLAGAGMATILGNTQVFGTALLSFVLFGEALTVRFVLSATAALIGVTLLVGIGSAVEFTPDYSRGVAYGLATGLAYAVFLVLLRLAARVGQEQVSSLASLAWFSTATAVTLALTTAVEQVPVRPPTLTVWLLLFALALIAQSLGWWGISSSIPKVSGAVGGLVLLIQPVLATLWGVILFDEQLQSLQVVGAVITLVAIYAGSTRR